MNTLSRRTSILALVSILALFANAVVAPAQSAASLDKHARKIHHTLTKYRSGNYLHLMLSNSTDAYGALGTMSDATFTFTSADSNATATYRYADVNRVRADDETIGHGAEHRPIRHLVPIVISAAVVAAGALTYEAVR